MSKTSDKVAAMIDDSDPFDAPASGDFFGKEDINAANGQLLAVRVSEFKDHVPTVQTKPGEKSPCVVCDIYVLTGEGAEADENGYLTFEGAMLWQKVLISALKPKVGKIVLARLGQGVAKNGNSAPWVLIDATDEDKVIGKKWHARWVQKADPFTG